MTICTKQNETIDASAKPYLGITKTLNPYVMSEHFKTYFMDIAAFGKLAERVYPDLSKGIPVLVRGRLTIEQWEAKDGGGKRERVVRTEAAPGLPFDHGTWEIVLEDWPADELARAQRLAETGEGWLTD